MILNKEQKYYYFQAVILILSFFIFFNQTIINLIKNWSANDNFSHGFLIPFISGFIIWKKRNELTAVTKKTNYWGLCIITAGVAINIIGNIGAELFTMRTAIILTIFGIVLYLFGFATIRAILVPLIYLFFMIPIPAIIWNKIAFPLQLFAAELSFQLVNIIGIPILREGNILQLSNTTLEVVDACSGLRSLTSLLALSAAFAYIVPIKIIYKWLLFLSAIPIAIFVNVLRITITSIMAMSIGVQTAQGFFHDLSGIFVFIVAFILLCVVYMVISTISYKEK